MKNINLIEKENNAMNDMKDFANFEGCNCNSVSDDCGQEKLFHFVNEFEMNEFTMKEIPTDLWTANKRKNYIPIIILAFICFAPLIYGFVSGKQGFILLSAFTMIFGVIGVLGYIGISAATMAKTSAVEREMAIQEHGPNAIYRISIGDTIEYSYDGIRKTVSYQDIDKAVEVDMYYVLRLKNGIDLPIWKLGFKTGSWDGLVLYMEQKLKK